MRIAIKPRPVLYFDGVCNLCERSVQFVIRNDKKQLFRFATLSSAAGQEALQHGNIAATKVGSVVLYFRGRYYTRSAAALHTLRLLGGLWQLLFVFMLVPPFIRDRVYDHIAANRYKWFGRKEECMIPTPELQERFLS
ncbi:DUF393 domain-containing protein [Nemorincola caseinilytica]|uniref:DUF393 domain-containing protein n=1 Tax=Nemorincola caseinilytica TaxID=2054315 RepID=A0ABP8ND77_9BACT